MVYYTILYSIFTSQTELKWTSQAVQLQQQQRCLVLVVCRLCLHYYYSSNAFQIFLYSTCVCRKQKRRHRLNRQSTNRRRTSFVDAASKKLLLLSICYIATSNNTTCSINIIPFVITFCELFCGDINFDLPFALICNIKRDPLRYEDQRICFQHSAKKRESMKLYFKHMCVQAGQILFRRSNFLFSFFVLLSQKK